MNRWMHRIIYSLIVVGVIFGLSSMARAARVSTPQITPTSTTSTQKVTVNISCSTKNAAIYYTLNGSVPNQMFGTRYTGSFEVATTTTVKAQAFLFGMDPSVVVTATYTINIAPPTVNPLSGTYYGPQTVTMTCATPDAVIRYTDNNTVPTMNSRVYSGPITVNGPSATIRAKAFKANQESTETSRTYTIAVAPPIMNPSPGTVYYAPQSVTITCATPGATIRFTKSTDGQTPATPTAYSPIYSDSIRIGCTTTIKAKAFLGAASSTEVLGKYTLQLAAPRFDPTPGIISDSDKITILCDTPDATINYSLDGKSFQVYSPSSSISLTKSTTILAYTTKAGVKSATMTGTYNVRVASPMMSPTPSDYPGAMVVTLGCPTEGATIRYTTTTNGKEPAEPTSKSTLYNPYSPISIPTSTRIKAKAFKQGMLDSVSTTGSYTIRETVAAPTFKTNPGIYLGQVSVALTCATKGATIRFTTNGDDPTLDNSTLYTAAILLTSDTVLKAKAFMSGMNDSPLLSGIFSLRVATPKATPTTPYTFTTSVPVSLSCTTPGAMIRYTTDSTEPTDQATLYSGPFTVTDTRVIKAIACKAGMTTSAIFSGLYVRAGSTFTASAQNITVTENSPGTTITLQATDPSGKPVKFSIVTPPRYGTLVTENLPVVTYIPMPNYAGQDAFSFRANNGKVYSNTAAVSLTMTAQNTPPTVADQVIAYDSAENGTLPKIAIHLGAVDAEERASDLVYMVNTNGISTTRLTGGGALWYYTPTPGIDEESFTYSAIDSGGAQSTNTARVILRRKREPKRMITTTYSYEYTASDPTGRLTSVQIEDQAATTFSYYTNGLLRERVTPCPGAVMGRVITTAYTYTNDGLGNVQTVTTTPGATDGSALVTTYNYTQDPKYAYTQSACSDEPITVTDSLGAVTHFRYDARGNKITEYDAAGNQMDYVYNLADQPEQVVLPASNQTGTGRSKTVTKYMYCGGPVLSTTSYDEHLDKNRNNDHIVSATRTTYGKAGEVLKVEDLKANPSTYETVTAKTYNAAYLLKTISDGKNQATTYTYDLAGNCTRVTYPDENHLDNYYNSQSKLAARVDATGRRTSYGYEGPGGMLSTIIYETMGRGITYSYDEYWRIGHVKDLTGESYYAYDPQGNLLSTTTKYAELANAFPVTYSFASNGTRHLVTTPGGTSLEYSDHAQRPTGVLDAQAHTAAWGYSPDSKIVGYKLGDNAYTAYAYNALDQLTDLTNYAPDGSTVSHYTGLVYDGSGNLTTLTATFPGTPASNHTLGYTYDRRDQLLSECYTKGTAQTSTFVYDPAGNPTTFDGQARTYNTNNQLNTGNGWTFAYDGNGNPTTYKGLTLAYDQENRLTDYGTYKYGYRADNLRAWKTGDTSNAKTYFLYDGTTPVCELDKYGTVLVTNTFGVTGLLSCSAGTTETYYLFDPSGNVVQRIDENGTVSFTPDLYTAYGKKRYEGSLNDAFGYQGQSGYYTDVETGLILCTNRYYDPATGRWLTRDPIGYEGGINLYGYCGNDPVNEEDPSGLTVQQAIDIMRKNKSKIFSTAKRYGIQPDMLFGVVFIEMRAGNQDRMINEGKSEAKFMLGFPASIGITQFTINPWAHGLYTSQDRFFFLAKYNENIDLQLANATALLRKLAKRRFRSHWTNLSQWEMSIILTEYNMGERDLPGQGKYKHDPNHIPDQSDYGRRFDQFYEGYIQPFVKGTFRH